MMISTGTKKKTKTNSAAGAMKSAGPHRRRIVSTSDEILDAAGRATVESVVIAFLRVHCKGDEAKGNHPVRSERQVTGAVARSLLRPS
ncbi:MAG: hypothetical protein Kow0047_13900 [Anaerolineae bacterium]